MSPGQDGHASPPKHALRPPDRDPCDARSLVGDARERIFVALSLAGEATAGDARIHAALDWLYEASARIVARRTPQLDLLGQGGAAARAR